LDGVYPSLVLISVGKDNRYGHPSQEVLDRLNLTGIPALRTDQEGMIRLSTFGSFLFVETGRGQFGFAFKH
jgi:competence protein ComEC